MKRQTKFGIVLAAAAVISVSVASLVCARGWVQQGADWYYADANNEFVTETIQSSGNSKFYLDQDGRMVRDYFLEDYNDNAYYFGSNGAMVTNTWVAIDSALVENQDDYVPDNYWYYFQASGKATKGSSGNVKKTTIDGKKYAFNEYGQMCTGWITSDGKVVNPDEESNPFAGDTVTYYAGGDNDGVLRAGWVTYYDGYDGDNEPETEYTNLYFYFNPSNNKMTKAPDNKTKKINGRTYAFSEEGVMLSGWDPMEIGTVTSHSYFSGEDDGHQVKKGWVYAVPSGSIDQKAKDDDEEKYMYFNNSGEIISDSFKKINGKYYVFNRRGIMKTGIIIWCNDGTTNGNQGFSTNGRSKYVDKLDLDWANGEDIAKRGILTTDNGVRIVVDKNSQVIATTPDDATKRVATNNGNVNVGDYVKLHYFGEDGARKTGLNNVEFADDTYTINTVGASGDKGSGVFSKKYYSLGILLKASADIRYGIYQTASDSILHPQEGEWEDNLVNGTYLVLTTSGSKQKGNKTAKKDADGNYWMIDPATSALKGIYTVGIKTENSYSGFKTFTFSGRPYADKKNDITTRELFTRYGDQLFVSDVSNEAIWNATWTAYYTNNNDIYYSCNPNNAGPCFQSDYGDGSNKWIPFGMIDNAKKSATFRLNTAADSASLDYFIDKPSNDYFLNCYWN